MSTPREIEGRWWTPDCPQDARFGTLREDDDDGLTLTTKEARSLSIDDIFRDGERFGSQPLMCGRDAGDKPVTLLHCMDEGSQRAGGMLARDYGVAFALLGFEATTQEQVRFTRVIADFTHLQAWLNLSCLNETQEDGTTCIRYRYPEDIPFTLTDGTRVTIRAHLSTHGGRCGEPFTFTERRLVEFAFVQPLGITTILDRLMSFRWLLTLLVGKTVHLTKLTALLPGVCDATGLETSIEVLGQHIDRTPPPKSPHAPLMLATFAAVQPNFAALLSRWAEYHERLDAVLSLYFSVRFNRDLYSNHRFLFLAQALEVYHGLTASSAIAPTAEYKQRLKRVLGMVADEDRDWVGEGLRYANKKTLAQRLDEILARHPAEAARIAGDVRDFADKIRHTRNYYTHFEERMKKRGKVAGEAELILLTERMQRLLEVCFLKDLGLDGPAVRKTAGKPLPRVETIALR